MSDTPFIEVSAVESTTKKGTFVVTAQTSDGKDYLLTYTIGESSGTIQTTAGKSSITVEIDPSVGLVNVVFSATGLTDGNMMINTASAMPHVAVKFVANADGSLWVVPNDSRYMKIYYQQQMPSDYYDLISELTYAVHMLYDWMILKESGATPTANQQLTITEIKTNFAPLLMLTLEKAMQTNEWRYLNALKPGSQLMNQVETTYLTNKQKAYGSI